MPGLFRRKAKRDLTVEEQLARGPVDLPFLALVVLLTVVGLLMLLSASYPSAYYNLEAASGGIDTGGDPYFYFKRQLAYAIIGFAGLFIASKINYQRYRWMSVFVLVGSIVLLALIFTPLGRTSNGSRRWLQLGIRFQPSEFAKIGVIMYFAARLSKRKSQLRQAQIRKQKKQAGRSREHGYFARMGIVVAVRRVCERIGTFLERLGFTELLPYGAILAVILVLIGLQSHLSCMILICIAAAAVLFAGGIGLGWFAAGGALLGGGLYWLVTKTTYMTERIESWKDPTKDPLGDGFQVLQSQTAIGSGGLLGLGLGNGKQKFLFLPEEHNDFIFAVVCEELGFVGACVIILLFALLIIRGFWLALHARDRFGTLLVVGITTLLAAQVLLNIGVVTGYIPPTGISLPFFSYGGTALAIQLTEMGMILSVSRQILAPTSG